MDYEVGDILEATLEKPFLGKRIQIIAVDPEIIAQSIEVNRGIGWEKNLGIAGRWDLGKLEWKLIHRPMNFPADSATPEGCLNAIQEKT